MYHSKYLKYKAKYLSLKSSQIGGYEDDDIVTLQTKDGQKSEVWVKMAIQSKTIKDRIDEAGIKELIYVPIDTETLNIVFEIMRIYASIDTSKPKEEQEKGMMVKRQEVITILNTFDQTRLINVLLAANWLDFKPLLNVSIHLLNTRLKKYDYDDLLEFRRTTALDTDNMDELFCLKLKKEISSTIPNDICRLIKRFMRKVYTFGYGGWGSLGHGDQTSLWIPTRISNWNIIDQVACGYTHVAIIRYGVLYTFGNNEWGQLGHGNLKNYAQPTRVPDVPGGFQNKDVSHVSCGAQYTAVIVNGRLYTFGNNTGYRSGQRDIEYLPVPTLVPDFKTGFKNENVTKVWCGNGYTAVIANGVLWTVGTLCGNVNYWPSLVPIVNQNVTQVSLGFLGKRGQPSSCIHVAIIANGQLYTWGNNSVGQLGLGDKGNIYAYAPILVPNVAGGFQNKNVTYVSCGYQFTAVIANGSLYTFGSNANGQLCHNPDEYPIITFPKKVNLSNVTQVSSGSYYSIVIADRKVYSFGSNEIGQLGLGDKYNQMQPTQITTIRNPIQVSCGPNFAAIIAY